MTEQLGKVIDSNTTVSKVPASILVQMSTAEQSKSGFFVTATFATELRRTSVVSPTVTDALTSPTRGKGLDVGRDQGVPHGCIDLGGGIVDCAGALNGD